MLQTCAYADTSLFLCMLYIHTYIFSWQLHVCKLLYIYIYIYINVVNEPSPHTFLYVFIPTFTALHRRVASKLYIKCQKCILNLPFTCNLYVCIMYMYECVVCWRVICYRFICIYKNTLHSMCSKPPNHPPSFHICGYVASSSS